MTDVIDKDKFIVYLESLKVSDAYATFQDWFIKNLLIEIRTGRFDAYPSLRSHYGGIRTGNCGKQFEKWIFGGRVVFSPYSGTQDTIEVWERGR